MKSIGRYEIERELGRGAMGVVYLARDPRLSRLVALKTYTLPDGVSAETAKEFHERFLREARAAAGLSHPGIVTIYDAGDDPEQGLPYIAMEFISGQSLKQLLDSGKRLDPAWVISVGAILAEALHTAHRAGIVHRDIKPANILIRESDGAAKIADFGVAHLKASDLTQSGAAIGSPGYMSPEQVRCYPMDGRSDLFSLAVLLYEALCGRRPFKGDDLVALAYSIAHDTQVPLRTQLPGCPAGLDRFFDRALSKDPDKRFKDGAAFRQALLEAASQGAGDPMERTVTDAVTMGVAAAAPPLPRAGADSTPASTLPLAGPVGRRRGRALMLGGAAVLCAVGLAAAAVLWFGRPRDLSAAAPGVAAGPGSAANPGGLRAAQPGTAVAGQAVLPGSDAARKPGEAARQEKGVSLNDIAKGEIVPVGNAARTPGHSPAPANQAPALKLTVPAGSILYLQLDKAVGSAISHAGETFAARITDPVVVGDRVVIPAGSSVHGVVREALPAKKGLTDKAGSLGLAFDQVRTTTGAGAAISAGWSGAGAKSGGKTAKTIGGSAAGGALLGKVLGGKSKDAALGSVLGGAIGTGIAAGTKGQDIELAAGTSLTIRLDQPVTLTIPR